MHQRRAVAVGEAIVSVDHALRDGGDVMPRVRLARYHERAVGVPLPLGALEEALEEVVSVLGRHVDGVVVAVPPGVPRPGRLVEEEDVCHLGPRVGVDAGHVPSSFIKHGPSSVRRPIMLEQPGPPLSQTMRGMSSASVMDDVVVVTFDSAVVRRSKNQ